MPANKQPTRIRRTCPDLRRTVEPSALACSPVQENSTNVGFGLGQGVEACGHAELRIHLLSVTLRNGLVEAPGHKRGHDCRRGLGC